MRTIFQYAAIAVFAFGTIVACNQAPAAATLVDVKGNFQKVRAGMQKAEKFNSATATFDLAKSQQIVMAKAQQAQAQDDAQLIKNIYQAMQAAENKAAELTGVKLMISDEPVQDGIFLFAMEANSAQNLTMEMYDEEGFQMAANSQINLTEGSNYKAVNVNSLNNGEYVVRLKDGEGKELARTITIKKD